MVVVLPPSQAAAVKKKASGSSFYLAMRLMPRRERDAMFAIYAFCRKVDDIADDGLGTRAERQEKLEAWRFDLEALYGGQSPQRVAFLAPAVVGFNLRFHTLARAHLIGEYAAEVEK